MRAPVRRPPSLAHLRAEFGLRRWPSHERLGDRPSRRPKGRRSSDCEGSSSVAWRPRQTDARRFCPSPVGIVVSSYLESSRLSSHHNLSLSLPLFFKPLSYGPEVRPAGFESLALEMASQTQVLPLRKTEVTRFRARLQRPYSRVRVPSSRDSESGRHLLFFSKPRSHGSDSRSRVRIPSS